MVENSIIFMSVILAIIITICMLFNKSLKTDTDDCEFHLEAKINKIIINFKTKKRD